MSILSGDCRGADWLSFMFETKLAGIFHVGPQQRLPCEWHSKAPKALIYDQETLSHKPMISIYPISKGSLPHIFHRLGQNGLNGCMGMLWSWAPLKNMARVDVYHDERGNLLGMHIYYENGAQRTVGECCVGFQPYRSWTKPSALYWSQPGTSSWVQVVFDDDPTGGDSEKWVESG